MKVPSAVITAILLATLHCTVQTTNGHVICTNTTVHVESNSSGIIQHVRESGSQGCILVLSGFDNGYISLPGVDPTSGSCSPMYPEVSINSQQYCVQGSISSNDVVLMTNGALIVEVTSRSIDNFTFEYYSNVGVCGDTVYTPDNRESSQLSAVLTSPPGLSVNRVNCTITIKSDLHIHFSVLFEVLHLSTTKSISIGDKSLPARSGKGDRLLATASNGELTLTLVNAQRYYFRLKYTVLHCDSPPVITNSTYSPTAPWLPGSNVTYSCVRGYQLKDESHSTIECQLNTVSNTSVWTDHHNVQCIPEPWCHSIPPDVNHSTSVRPDNYTAMYNCTEGYTTNISTSERKSVCSSTNNETIPWSWSLPPFICYPEPWCQSSPPVVNHSTSVSPDNYTAIYNCIEGYTTNISTSERKSVCSSANNKTIPWSWSTPLFTCYPVECVDNFHQLGVDNSSAGARYGVNQTYTYDCMFGYKKYQTETIRCRLDGNWSSSPNCTQMGSGNNSEQVKTTPSTLTIILASSAGGLVGLAVVVALVAFFCIRSHRGKDSSSRTDLTGPPATMQGEENPYHVLDGPGQGYARRSEISGAYDMVTLPSDNNYSEVSPVPQATPAATNQLDVSQSAARNDVYAEVQKVLGKKPFQAPVLAKPEPVYEEGPILPSREDQVVFEENSLYDSSDRARGYRGDENAIEMVDNDLYDRRY